MKKSLILLISFLWSVVLLAQTSPAGMVTVPEGIYTPFLKSDDGEKEEVKPFYLDVYPVTNAEYFQFTEENPEWKKGEVSGLFADQGYLKHWEREDSFPTSFLSIANKPVTNISWHAATAYCEYYNKRLPSVMEWEYAAHAPIVNDDRPMEEIILEWYSHPTPSRIPNIGLTVINDFGLHDMHGLIWEWVFDFNSIILDSDSRSNTETVQQNFYCASGSYGATNKEDYASFMRFAYRSSLKSNYTVSNLGFRCARDINENF